MSNLNEIVQEMLAIEGTLGASILDVESGMALAAAGNGTFDMDVTTGGAVDVLRAWNKSASRTDRSQHVENVVGIYPQTIAFVRVLTDKNEGLAMMLLLERSIGNQALANHKLGVLAERLEV